MWPFTMENVYRATGLFARRDEWLESRQLCGCTALILTIGPFVDRKIGGTDNPRRGNKAPPSSCWRESATSGTNGSKRSILRLQNCRRNSRRGKQCRNSDTVAVLRKRRASISAAAGFVEDMLLLVIGSIDSGHDSCETGKTA